MKANQEEFLKKLQPFPSRAKVWWILHMKGSMFADNTYTAIFFGTYSAFTKRIADWDFRKFHGFSLSILGAKGERYLPPKRAPKILRILAGGHWGRYNIGAEEYVRDLMSG